MPPYEYWLGVHTYEAYSSHLIYTKHCINSIEPSGIE